jgi:two-component system, OmpR family, response regulator
MRRLLVMDDSRDLTDLVCSIGVAAGFEVRVVNRGRDFTQVYGEFAPDVIVLDLVMPELDGIEVLNQLSDSGSSARVVLLTGADVTYLRMATQIGSIRGVKIAGTLTKPFRVHALRELLAE